jgi:UDP-N-acetylmuramoylalanine--D-glutamate ligase
VHLDDLNGKRIAILGDGAEGEAAARLLLTTLSPAHLGVFSNRESIRTCDAFAHAEHHLGPLQADALCTYDIAIKSPGIPLRTQGIVEAAAGGLVITSGTSLWLQTYRNVRTIGVTGTKGKSTTVTMIASALTACGHPARAVGNIGVPLLACAPPDTGIRYWVLELSSAQCADLAGTLDLAVLLNLSPEHLDWHGDVETYYAAKLRMLNLAPPGRRIIGGSCPVLAQRLAGDPDVIRCHQSASQAPSACLEPYPPLRHHFGRHAHANACVASRVLAALGVPQPAIGPAIAAAPALPHRLEPIRRTEQALWINDSLSTTPLSVLAALDAFAGRPVILLLGGHDRGLPWDDAADAIAARRHQPEAIITMPNTGDRVASVIRAAAAARALRPPRILAAEDMPTAVAIAHREAASIAAPEDTVVVLSPGAPSYHAYTDHAHRARAFAAAIDHTSPSHPEHRE